MTDIRTALVIGGGIAGPAVAMALRKAGIQATVYEARPSSPEAGVFLTVGSNGVDALRVLGVDQPVLDVGFPTPAIDLFSATGKRLGAIRTGGRLSDGTTSQTLRRADLYRVLLDAVAERGVRVEYGKRLVSAEQTGDGVRAEFADGTEAFGDVLVGCDGVHSRVRRLIDPAAPAPRYSGLLGTGGYAEGVRLDAEPGTYRMIFGRQAFFGWVSAPGGQVWWFANVPHRAEPARGQAATALGPDPRGRLVELFAADTGPAVDLIRATPDPAPLDPSHAIAHLPTWHNQRMVVIGDAAHAPTPSSGQGASLAIEDAVVLAMCLRDLPTPHAAFARFTALRRPRVERIIRWAARTNSSKAAGPAARVLRDALMPTVLRMTANSKVVRQVHEHHINWNTPATEGVTTRVSGVHS